MANKKKSGAYDKKNDYIKANYKRFSLTYKKSDPVTEKLEGMVNVSAYVRDLIMADIEAHKPVKSTVRVTPEMTALVPKICAVFDTDIDETRWTEKDIEGTMRMLCDSIPEISEVTSYDDTRDGMESMSDFLRERRLTETGIIGIYAQPDGEGSCKALGVFNGGFIMVEAFHGMEEDSGKSVVDVKLTHMLDFSDLLGNPTTIAKKLNERIRIQLFE